LWQDSNDALLCVATQQLTVTAAVCEGPVHSCPVGDVRVFADLDTAPAHRRSVARWFACMGLRMPAVLSEPLLHDQTGRSPPETIKSRQEATALLRAIGRGSRLDIVRASQAVCSGADKMEVPLSLAEAACIVERRPQKTTGVVYALWDVAMVCVCT
jgi:hypothetical protein